MITSDLSREVTDEYAPGVVFIGVKLSHVSEREIFCKINLNRAGDKTILKTYIIIETTKKQTIV